MTQPMTHDNSIPNSDIALSLDVTETRRKTLADLIPEAFSEGRLDISALKRALGEPSLIDGGERYRLDWAGKSDAYKVLQTPSSATLRPQPELSINFDAAQHIFIEGENLEVLKVLQKAYFGKVKLIYIDPPYNTGSDSFIYPDRYQESKEEYLKRINDLTDDGTLMREGFFRKNNRENGQFHSNWLSMMLPRLYIARNLLRDDGVIFISCDDNEVHNLRCLMNEIFGEENFIANIVWQKRYVSNVTAKYLSDMHDHILVFARHAENITINRIERSEEQIADYKNADNDPRGPWRAQDLSASKPYKAGMFTIKTPAGLEVNPPPGRYWRCNQQQYEDWVTDNRIWFGKEGTARPMLKAFLSEVQDGLTPNTWWTHSFAGHNKEATLEVKALFDGAAPFDTPKPIKLISRILELCSDSDSLIMDFFAGSGTTAQAILEANKQDKGRRQFLCIQLPESCEENSVAAQSKYRTISDIGRERIRRVIEKITAEADFANPVPQDLGVKCFQLTPSNFKQWRGDGIETANVLAEQIEMFVDSVKSGAKTDDLLFELLLKFGQPLTTPIEWLDIEGQRIAAIHNRSLLFILEGFSFEMIEQLLALKPKEIIALDRVFAKSDELQSNLDLACRDVEVKFTCI